MANPRVPLYVRLPQPTAEKLDRHAFERKTSKQDLVTGLIAQLDDGLTVGKHHFRATEPPEVLTLAEAADLLQTTEEAVTELAEAGEIPAKQVGGEWRFARAAILKWLGDDG